MRKKIAAMGAIVLAFFMAGLSPQFVNTASASETFGIVGCLSRVKDTNLNEERVEHFKVFNEVMLFELQNVLGARGYDVIDISPEAFSARVDETYLRKLDLGDTAGVMTDFNVRPDYLVYGYLTNFTISRGEAAIMKNFQVRADLSVRIVDTKTGRAVFVATGTGKANSRINRLGKVFRVGAEEISDECLDEALEQATGEIAKKIAAKV